MSKEEFSKDLSDWQIFKRLVAYVLPSKYIFFLTIFLTIFIAILSPARPWLIQQAVDGYIKTADLEGLTIISILMVVLLFIEGLTNFSYVYFGNMLAQTVVRDMRVEVYDKIIHYKLQYYDNMPVGRLVTRVISDIESVANVFSSGILTVIGDVLKLIVVISVMFYTSWQLTLFSLSTVPLLLIGTYLFKAAIKKAFGEVRNKVSALNTFVQEHISGMNIVQIFNREQIELDKFKKINEAYKKANIASIWAYSIFFPVVEFLSACSLALLIWYGAKGVVQGTVTFGELMAFILYIHMLFRPIRQLADNINILQMGVVSARRVFNVIDEDAFIENIGDLKIKDFKGEVSFRNVWFAYQDLNWVLKDISFEVKEGQTLAVVGSTGSGKTSIINLLGKFYNYQKGSISISGNDLKRIEVGALRKQVVVVTQDVFLFSDTILNNITLGDENISREEVISAAKEIGVHQFIQKLPGKYNYNVRERGGMLSVGQRQLIAFVRAYVHKPALLILDEATSSIDQESERLIQEATEKITKNRTSIVIAHRLSTIRTADSIMVIEKGRVEEIGSHEELLKKEGKYKKLYEVQFKHQG